MKIKKIILNNFRAYQGQNVYDFDNEKHINIISAENGNGKTSFLTAIICCLYGSEMFGSTHKTKEYQDFIMNSNNRNNKSNKMNIEIEFVHINSNFKIKRTYTFLNNDFKEKKLVYENDKEIKNFNINSIIPITMMELFFFDGEKILKIIDNGTFSDYIINLVKRSFEIDVFEILKKDIEISIQNEFKLNKTGTYNKLLLKKKELTKDLQYHNNKIKELENIIFINQSNILKLEDLMDEHKLLKNDDLEKLIIIDEELKKKIKNEEYKLNKFIKNELNIILHQKYLIQYAINLEETRSERLKILNNAYKNFDKNIDVGIPYHLEKQIISYKNMMNTFNNKNIKELIKTLNKNKIKHIKNREVIKLNAKGSKYLSFSDNYDLYEKEKFDGEEKLKNMKIKTLKLQKELDKTLLSIDTEEKKILENELIKNSILEKNKLEKVILEYIDEKKDYIYKKIEREVLNILQKDLLHKENLIDEIKISNNSIILNYKGKKINVNQLSAGEKQVVIVGFILGIIKASKLDIPLILDTFVGRLDIDHTKNLLNYLNNKYGNQVVFLSTNREIGINEIKILEKSLDKHYVLKNNGYKINISEVK